MILLDCISSSVFISPSVITSLLCLHKARLNSVNGVKDIKPSVLNHADKSKAWMAVSHNSLWLSELVWCEECQSEQS